MWNAGLPWHNGPDTWRPYANNTGGGVMRNHMPRNDSNWQNDPFYGRYNNVNPPSLMAQTFNQQYARAPYAVPNMNAVARQRLLKNTHVPGLKTGQQLRDSMHQRKRKRVENLSKRFDVAVLDVKMLVFSEKIELRWVHSEFKRMVKYDITYVNVKTNEGKSIERSPTSPFFDFKVEAGETYRIDIKCISTSNSEILAHWTKEVRAEFSYSELKTLYNKCLSFVTKKLNNDVEMHEFWMMYRCKPKIYWDEIHHYCNDVMQKYIKDDNGQPGNLINGKINGLFFSARLNPNLTLPQQSPFGNVRMCIDAVRLLHPDKHNIYFADFYCNKNMHYVTIVICVINSETDRYCADRLMKLNPLNNPFVKLVPPTARFQPWRFFVNYSLWVEMLYTEDIELNIGQFSAIQALGAGTSRIGGLPNNKICNICNLYPKQTSENKKNLENKDDTDSTKENVDIIDVALTSTLSVIRETNNNADSDVVDTLCSLVDRVEENCLSISELCQKQDPEISAFVEKMNKEIIENGFINEKKNGVFVNISKNLLDFVEDFERRRDNIVEEIEKLMRLNYLCIHMNYKMLFEKKLTVFVEMEEFVKWAKGRGYQFDGLEITKPPGNCGNGIYATRNFRPENIMISIPEYDMITAGLVIDLPFYRKLTKNIEEKMKPMEILTMFFCFEDLEKSAWSPYLKVLPQTFDTPAFQKIDYNLQELPLEIRKYWIDQKLEIEQITTKLLRLFPELTADKILWAWHVVNTRCIFVENIEHDKVDNSDGDTIAVIPFVDMLNHDPTEFQGIALHEKVNGQYVVRAKKSVSEGDQIFVCYGPHSNTRLLIEYGFTVPGNMNTKVLIPKEVLVTLAKIAEIKVTREHEMILDEVGLPSHLYATDEGPSWALKNNIRILLLEHWQMANSRWKKIIYSHDPIEEEVENIIEEKLKIILTELKNGIVEKAKKMPKTVSWMWEDQIRVCETAIKSLDN
ncbi:unnamed protein product [Caenorhabditis angaria]|uniref:SET domain-containing protein n=1 Tax=Caenorhabditis angaria TaxID=860376 RepID=A0A9P1MSZ8_9PELO|nr:unnamed protein product [Caenorhabditis angaria]